MRKTFILLLPFIIGFYGCQSLRNFTDTHAHVFETAIISRDEHSTRNIRVEVGEYLQENLISVQFERVVEYEELEGQEYLYVSGSIKKSLNKDLATVKITARFLDQKGQIELSRV